MSAHYKEGTGRSCQQNDNITDNRFTEWTTRLLMLGFALNPIDEFKSFKINDICSLASEFYPGDFT